MDLPGLGTFVLDPSITIEPESGKHSKPTNLEGVTFESNLSIKESPELIHFISSKTGKIKALASADLESHLGLAQQFLNIGKPFLFEGIGSMVKIQSGEFAFTSGLAMPSIMKDYTVKEISSTSAIEESSADYNSIFYPRKAKTKWKKPVAILLFLAGLALAIWGGYTVYKKTTAKKENTPGDEEKKQETVLVIDTAKYQKDSIIKPLQISIVPAGNYKFVLETSDSDRAVTRYTQLKTFLWDVQMETKDSLSYKLFLLLPASAADTSRLRDSLSQLTGRRVYIE